MYVSITSSSYNFISLPQGGTMQQASFTIQADANIPYATAVTFDYDLSFGLYNAQESFDIIANMASEDYETGNICCNMIGQFQAMLLGLLWEQVSSKVIIVRNQVQLEIIKYLLWN